MLKRLPLFLAGTAIAVAACAQTPSVPSSTAPAQGPYQVQQADDNEGVDDASLDALIRELDAEPGDQTATQSAVPMQTQGLAGYKTQQWYGGGGGQYGGYGGGQYWGYGGYNVFARCQRIYRRCLNRAFTTGNYNTYRLCRRLRNRCVSAQWWRY